MARRLLFLKWRSLMIRLRNVLVATDFGPAANAALTYGRALARSFGARLHVLHAMENSFLRASPADPAAHKAAVLRTLHEQVRPDQDSLLKPRVVLEMGDNAADAITDYARTAQIDLIVMGTNGRGTMAQFLVGSVAERVVRTAQCPVLTVKHPEHEFVLPDQVPQATARPEQRT
jgi:nucleotide-binding universal stress UspA family protein